MASPDTPATKCTNCDRESSWELKDGYYWCSWCNRSFRVWKKDISETKDKRIPVDAKKHNAIFAAVICLVWARLSFLPGGFLDNDESSGISIFCVGIPLLVFAVIIFLLAWVECAVRIFAKAHRVSLYGFILLSISGAYSIWLLYVTFDAMGFEPDKNIESQLNDELSHMSWPIAKLVSTPSSMMISYNNDNSHDVVIVNDRQSVSYYHWCLPSCRRASSIQNARFIISIHETVGNHPSAEWVEVLPSGERISKGKVVIPIWEVEVLDRKEESIFNKIFTGYISDSASLVQNLAKPGYEMDVDRAPVNDFLSFFGLHRSQWNKFLYPEKRLLELVGII
jgi:hypothetical protein